MKSFYNQVRDCLKNGNCVQIATDKYVILPYKQICLKHKMPCSSKVCLEERMLFDEELRK